MNQRGIREGAIPSALTCPIIVKCSPDEKAPFPWCCSNLSLCPCESLRRWKSVLHYVGRNLFARETYNRSCGSKFVCVSVSLRVVPFVGRPLGELRFNLAWFITVASGTSVSATESRAGRYTEYWLVYATPDRRSSGVASVTPQARLWPVSNGDGQGQRGTRSGQRLDRLVPSGKRRLARIDK